MLSVADIISCIERDFPSSVAEPWDNVGLQVGSGCIPCRTVLTCLTVTEDVVDYAADLMRIEPPAETEFSDADMTPMARSFYSENKRVKNAVLKDAGAVLSYPNYRVALDHHWQQGDWRGDKS